MDPDPPSTNTLSSAATSISNPSSRQSYTVPLSPNVSELTGLVTAYTLSPKQATQTAYALAAATAMNPHPPSSNPPGHGQFGLALASLQTQQDEGQAYMSSSQSQDDSAWSAITTQASSDDLEHYTFSSPTASGYTHRNVSAQSSPRSGDSPGYFNAPPWQSPIPEAHGSQHGLPTTSFTSKESISAPRESISYYQYSSAPFPSVEKRFHSQSFDGSDSSFPMRSNMTSMSEHGQSTSPCSSISGVDVMGAFPTSEPGQFSSRIESGTGSQDGSPASSSHGAEDNGSLSPASLANIKTEEPYAQLIYRAFMSTEPRYSMTLQDIYQWFREHTDKGKSDSKGWQNSIRHNLSMNQAFTKDHKAGAGNSGSGDENTEDDPAKASPSPATDINDRKKTTKWYLEPWAVTGGVQSTTRYRKGNPSRRGRKLSNTTSASLNMKQNASYAAARALSGRKGGINKFRVRQEAAQRLRTLHTNARPIALHHYPPLQPLHHHQHQRQLSHLMHTVMDGPYSQFMPAAPGMEYDYPDPNAQLYPAAMTTDQHQHRHGLIHRAPSPPVVDEPVTPEPSPFNIKCEPPAHLLPLHRAGLSTSSSGPGTFHYTTTNGQNHTGGVVGIPTAGGAFSLHGGNVAVGVYDEVSERYGWGSSTTTGSGGGGGGVGSGGVGGVSHDGVPYCGPY